MIDIKYKLTLLSLLLVILISACSGGDSSMIEFSDESIGKYEERLLQYYYVNEVGPPKVVEDGILFTFAEDYNIVELSGDFLNWQFSIPLIKGRYGVFYYLYQEPIKAGNYAYKYRVDDMWMNDPLQTNRMFDAQNQELSYFVVEHDILYYRANPIYNDDNTVTFFYKNETAEEVNFALNEYGFDYYRYPMEKDINGIWSITLRLTPGPYYYSFVVDGAWTLDPINYNIVQSDKDIQFSFITIR